MKAATANHLILLENCQFARDGNEGPDLVDVVQVANLQSHFHTAQALSEDELARVPGFKKLGIQTQVLVVELEENSEDYAAAMALFGPVYNNNESRLTLASL